MGIKRGSFGAKFEDGFEMLLGLEIMGRLRLKRSEMVARSGDVAR